MLPAARRFDLFFGGKDDEAKAIGNNYLAGRPQLLSLDSNSLRPETRTVASPSVSACVDFVFFVLQHILVLDSRFRSSINVPRSRSGTINSNSKYFFGIFKERFGCVHNECWSILELRCSGANIRYEAKYGMFTTKPEGS